jgi:hypothetical protein
MALSYAAIQSFFSTQNAQLNCKQQSSENKNCDFYESHFGNDENFSPFKTTETLFWTTKRSRLWAHVKHISSTFEARSFVLSD